MELTFTKSGFEIRAALATTLERRQVELDVAVRALDDAVADAERAGMIVDRSAWTLQDPTGTMAVALKQTLAVAVGEAVQREKSLRFQFEHTELLLRQFEGRNLDRDFIVAESDLLRLGF